MNLRGSHHNLGDYLRQPPRFKKIARAKPRLFSIYKIATESLTTTHAVSTIQTLITRPAANSQVAAHVAQRRITHHVCQRLLRAFY